MAPSYYKFSIEKGDFLPDFVNFRVDQFIQENICKFYEKSVSKAAVGEVVSNAEEEMVVSNAVVEEVVTKTWEGLLTVEFTQIIVWRMGMYEELS